MKNLITYCVIFLTTTLMLSSCGTISIEKRHHNKGFYISHNNVKSSNKTVTTEKIETSETASNNVNEETETATIRTEENAVNTTAMTATDVVENSEVEESTTATATTTKTKEARTSFKEGKELVPFSLKKTASKFKNVYSASKSKYAPAEGDGYSLLWIIIIVLLILWLLGYLGGIGGETALIHLLLVIALILLILWLLRVI